MMSRAERAIQLHAKLYTLKKLQKICARPELDVVVNTWSYGGIPTKRSEMQLELTELKRQMGGSERREFKRLLSSWKGTDEAPPQS